MTPKQLREKRAAIVKQMQALVDANPGGLNAEQTAQFDKIDAEVIQLTDAIARAEKMIAHNDYLAQAEPANLPNVNASVSDDEVSDHEKKADVAFSRYMRLGMGQISSEERTILNKRFIRDANGAVNRDQFGPRAALTTSNGAGGEYLVPTGFSNKMEEGLKWFGGIEQFSEVFTTETGAPIPYPTDNDTTQMATLLGVNQPAVEADPAFGNMMFNAYKFTSGIVQIPIELLQDSYFDLDGYIARKFATRFGRAYNHYGTVGTGTQQPTGVATVTPIGVTAANGNTATVTGDNFIDLEHAVDRAYRQGARFMMHDQTLKIIKKLKDNYGRYLYLSALADNAPDTINGYPYIINNDMPVPAASAGTILFGDFTAFKIRKVAGYTMLRLTERYAEYGQVAFIAFARWDSNLVDPGTHPILSFNQSAT